MNTKDIASLRLASQRIAGEKFERPDDVVNWMGAVQAQDYVAALWAIALRTQNTGISDVEKAIANKQIVRTWPMRGTLHFIPPEDIRWMLKLMTPRVISSAASRHRNLGLDDTIFTKSRSVLEKALRGGNILTRNEMCEVLEREGISTGGQRGIHIFWVLSQEGLLCFGPHKGKQPTFVLLDEWLPQMKALDREESFAKLAKKYFISHGPATLRDFVWWTGLKVSDAKIALELARSELTQETVDGKVYWMSKELPDVQQTSPTINLLPGFDEYLLGYADRSAALNSLHKQKIIGGGIFFPIIVIDGQVVGTWKRIIKKNSIIITPSTFRSLDKSEKQALEIAAERYGKCLNLPISVTY